MELNKDLYQYPKLITVFGGTGFVGRHVVEVLTKRGYRVRVAVRHPERSYFMLQVGDVGQTQMLATDVLNRESVVRALIDADAAIYLPGVMFESGQNSYAKIHIEGATNVAELAASANIPLIHMSALGADVTSDSTYLKTKALGEEAVLLAHNEAIIMKPSVIFGPEDRFFNKFADVARFSWFLPLFGGGQSKIQPVYVGDVANFVIACLEGRVAKGTRYELGGKEVMTLKTALQVMLNVIKRKKRLQTLPPSVALMLGRIFGFLAKIPMVPKITNREQVQLLLRDNCVSQEAVEAGRTFQGVGIEPRAMEAVLPAYLWRFRLHGQFAKNVTPDWSR